MTDRDVRANPRSDPTSPVVVGVDGSTSSVEALRWGLDYARMAGRPLVAVSTWEWPAYTGFEATWPETLDVEADARETLDTCVAKVLGTAGDEVTCEVVQGHPSTVLVERSHDAALLVVGSRGHGELAGMLIGSVSSYLATHAACPVVIVRG